ncbi:MAG TPA: hypothetical protein VIL82_06780 [Solirubrobacteraceae bacterium]
MAAPQHRILIARELTLDEQIVSCEPKRASQATGGLKPGGLAQNARIPAAPRHTFGTAAARGLKCT